MYKKQPNSYRYGDPCKYPPYTVGALSGFGTPVDLGVEVQASPVDDKINGKDDANRNNKKHKIEQLRFNARSEFAHGATLRGCLLGGMIVRPAALAIWCKACLHDTTSQSELPIGLLGAKFSGRLFRPPVFASVRIWHGWIAGCLGCIPTLNC